MWFSGAPRPAAPRPARGGAVVCVFLAGVAVGLAIPWQARTPTERGSATPAKRDAQPVRGTSAAATAGDRVAVSSPSPRRHTRRPPLPQPAAAEHHDSPSAIARAALQFTVFLQGEDVYGAGILLDDEGHVLTCLHVIEGLERVTVSFVDGVTSDARLLDSDSELDLALLEIDTARAPGMLAASVATLEPGDEVFAMGAPRKMKFSLSRGMASFVGRRFDDAYYLQTDLPLNGGSSGGPIMNRSGRVVAIASFVLKQSEGLSFALPIDYAYRRFGHLLKSSRAAPARAAFEHWLSELERAPAAL